MVPETEQNYIDGRKLTLTQNHYKMAANHCNMILPIIKHVMSTEFRFAPTNCNRMQRTAHTHTHTHRQF
jgi:hypothetical protein